MDKYLVNLFTDIQEFTICFSCIVCFIYFRKLSFAQQIIFYYLFFVLIINSAASRLADLRVNNLLSTHLLVLGEFIFLSLYFREVLKKYTFFSKYFQFYFGIIIFLILANTIYLEPVNTFNTNGKILVLFIIIVFSLWFFYDRSKNIFEIDRYEKSTRIITAALLLYYSGSFFMFLFYKFTVNNELFYSNKVLVFNSTLYLVFTVLILVAMLMVIFHRKLVKEQ